MSGMNEPPAQDAAPLPPDLRFLKILVAALAGTMIAGLITIIALLVIRMPQMATPRPDLPAGLALPDGARAEAVTMGRSFIAVVTDRNEILIFDPKDGHLRQRIPMEP